MARAFSLRQRRSSDASPPPDGVARTSCVSGMNRTSMASTVMGTPPGLSPRTETMKRATSSSPTGSVPREPHQQGYTDAMAAAMLRTADEAASVVQRRARARNSRMTEDLEDDNGVPAPSGTAQGVAAAAERFAARMEAAGAGAGIGALGGGGGGGARAEPSLLAVLQKLEQMDARLQAMERASRGWFQGLVDAVSCVPAKSGGDAW